MSHRYIRLMNCNCNCNSNAYRSSRTSSGGDTLIFNFNSCCNNIPTAHCGGFWGGFGNMWSNMGGFWGGVGAGLGFGAISLGMRWLTGGIVNLCTRGSWGHPLQDYYGGRGNAYGNYGNYYGNPWGYQQTGLGGNAGTVGDSSTTVTGKPSSSSRIETVGQSGASGAASAGQTTAAAAEDEITIDGKKVKISDLTAEQIAGLKSNDITELNNSSKLSKVLDVLGAKIGVPDNNSISLPTTMDKAHLEAIKAISDALGLDVTVAHNPNAKGDKWVKGKIDNINLADGKLEYTIDCAKSGLYGLTYDVKQKEASGSTYTLSLKGSDGKKAQTKSKDGKTVWVNPKEYTYNSQGYLYNDKDLLTTEKE